jgi:hypothetical protein
MSRLNRRVKKALPVSAERLPLNQRGRPTAERMRHAGGHFTCGHSGQITMRNSPLERALARGIINAEQYAAAQKYRHHWYHAGLSDGLVSIDLTRVFAGGPGTAAGMMPTENQVFHRERYREAAQAIGKIGAHVLESVACREIRLQEVGYALGWRFRHEAYAAAAERLKDALDELRRIWGMG